MISQITERSIAETLQHTSMKDGHTMGLVKCNDESLDLSYDGSLIVGLTWPRADMEECVDVFEHFVSMHGGVECREPTRN